MIHNPSIESPITRPDSMTIVTLSLTWEISLFEQLRNVVRRLLRW
jgi:hypothetical protein